MEFFATCPAGFERLLANELTEIGITRPRPLRGQVAFFGELSDAYHACMWSRLASRVVLVLARHDAKDSDELYAGAQTIAWEEHLAANATFAIDASAPTPSFEPRSSWPCASRMPSSTNSRQGEA
jgi:23S rRNA (guanine2445-N2)-methyltransferase / 23S rRNA (guanine2069-N7)-methyltransferase